jgi:hypothetical protein
MTYSLMISLRAKSYLALSWLFAGICLSSLTKTPNTGDGGGSIDLDWLSSPGQLSSQPHHLGGITVKGIDQCHEFQF